MVGAHDGAPHRGAQLERLPFGRSPLKPARMRLPTLLLRPTTTPAISMIIREPEPEPLSPGLLATDGAICMLYSFSASIAGLFTSGEYMSPSLETSVQDYGTRNICSFVK